MGARDSNPYSVPRQQTPSARSANKNALLASPLPVGVRAGLGVSRRPARIASRVRSRGPRMNCGPWRRLPAPEYAQFAALDLPPGPARSSALVANDVPRLAAESAWRFQSFEPGGPARSARHDAGLRQRGEVEAIGDTFIAERRAVQSSDERRNSICDGLPLGHDLPLRKFICERKTSLAGFRLAAPKRVQPGRNGLPCFNTLDVARERKRANPFGDEDRRAIAMQSLDRGIARARASSARSSSEEVGEQMPEPV